MLTNIQKKPKGFALALTLFLIVILATVCFGALNVTTLDSRTAVEDYKSSRAFYAARAGVAFAKAELTDSARVSLTEKHVYPKTYLKQGNDQDAEEAFSMTITPAVDNNNRVFRIWKIESTGYYDNASRSVVAYIEQESFAKYGYFTDVETNSGTVINFAYKDRLTGSVHTNGFFTMNGHPSFGGQVSSANRNDTSHNVSTDVYTRSDGVKTSDNKYFYHATNKSYTTDGPVALNDSADFSFAGGQQAVPLPKTTNDEIIQASKDSQSKFDGNYRVVFTKDGKAKFYKQVTETVKVWNGRSYVYETKTYYKGYPTKTGDPDTPEKAVNTTVSPGICMYVNGNMEVSGDVRGRCTLACSNDCYLVDDLQYVNDSKDVLGILSNKNIYVRTPNNVRQDFYIDAIMMALTGSFQVENYNTGSYRGTLHLFGGIIQNKRGAVGTGNLNSTSTGYDKNYVYDPKLETMPPLNFPNTGKFRLRYFIDKGSLGGV